ncbi:hypothetical protein GGI15_002711 [Coemansia interrupta]|uniref:HTH APSES-type domain-containing protein n=1 Tax=Coemansia interrupta TaxID=1126814 RepID=A0A9W8LIH2_9FUNG|nr:hypothetical protein GGI15_002711 [Coemansia interrupta]
MSTLHTQYSNGQAATSGTGAPGTAGIDASHDAAGMGNSSASRDVVAVATAAAAAAAASGVLQGTDYSRSYNTMTPVGHGQMLPPPTQFHSQQQQQRDSHQSLQQQQQSVHHSHQQQQQQQQQQHHHALPSMDMNGSAVAAAVAGYQNSYGLADGTGAGAGNMVNLMSSPTATSWGASPTSPLSTHNPAVAAAAAAAAGHHQQTPNSWYGSMYQHPHYSPTGQGMVMYHDSYATSPTAVSGSYYPQRARLTTTLWEDEQTLVYQVDCRGICVARRHDDNMINGTKLLNVVGMSRGKRDGILKNEKGRRVVKVGPMHLKGVWIPFERARFLADQFKVVEVLFPIFQPDPNSYLYGTLPINSPTTAAGLPSAGSDPYSAAGYPQLTRAQDAYDHSMVVAAAAVNTPTTSSSTASHSHSASLSQAMVAGSGMHHAQQSTSQHHHSLSQGQQQQPQSSVAQGLAISYISSPPRLPASPPSALTGLGGSSTSLSSAPLSPTSSSYAVDKAARYTPYGGGFQTSASKPSMPGSKRGSIDHHYHSLQQQRDSQQQQQQQHSSALSSIPAKPHHHQDMLTAGSDVDGMSQQSNQQQQQQQQPTMSSSYFDGLMAKSDQ